MVFIAMNTFTVEAAPSLVNIGVATKGKIVVINARLIEGFTDSIEEAIENGVPITFTFEAELRQVNDFWKVFGSFWEPFRSSWDRFRIQSLVFSVSLSW